LSLKGLAGLIGAVEKILFNAKIVIIDLERLLIRAMARHKEFDKEEVLTKAMETGAMVMKELLSGA
ncbi:MAG: hypothetical protein F6K24_49480, partial [Okeania sp. SIO2D1]|nr:hypothetical protein [Okeania sp. SIO2D1]